MPMETENTQELLEKALEEAIETLELIATDDNLNHRLRETQELCNRALTELRGFGHDSKREDWQQN